MAKILTTAIVADIRNKLNGSVFSKNRYGAYVRTKVTPVNPQTTAQQAQRNKLSTNSQAWRGLTEGQRQGWIAAASSFPATDIFGNPKVLSGNALYVKLNNNLHTLGLPSISDAPAPVAIPALSLTNLQAISGTNSVSLTFDPAAIPADFSMVIEATPQMGAGISFVKNRYRQLVVKPAATTSPVDISDEYVIANGALTLGQKVFMRAFLVSNITGQAGIPVSISAVVTD